MKFLTHTLLLLLALTIAMTGCLKSDQQQQQQQPQAATVSYIPPQRTDMLMGPYVNTVDQTSAQVLWVTAAHFNAPAQIELEIPGTGEMRTLSAGSSPIKDRSELLQTVAISGLQPGQTYRYVVQAGRDRSEGTFRTSPPLDYSEPFRFLVYGDTRTRPIEHSLVAQAMAREAPFDLVLNTGDLIANGTVWEQWQTEFFDPAAPILTKAAMWPARGNHEMDAVLYRRLFNLPGNGLYYSFDFANVHFVVLDPYIGRDLHGEMVQWFEKDLAAAAKRSQWIVVNYHEPTFNVGGHGSTFGQQDILPLMEKYGVDVVVTGHSHLYERFLPIGQPGQKPIIHLVTGGGGAPNYPKRPSPILVKSHSLLHYCVFDVQGNRMRVTARTPEGNQIDRFELVKTDGRYQDEVMAQAVETKHAVDVTFLYARIEGDYVDVPIAGAQISVIIEPDAIPAGSKVRISQATNSKWAVVPVEGQGGTEPIVLRVTPPEDIRLRVGGMSPLLTVKLEAEVDGRSYSHDGVPVTLSPQTVRRLTPEPVAVAVPHAATPIVIDGNLDEWADVPFVLLPTTGQRSTITRIAWRADGLYGAVNVQDESINTSLESAWTADSIELFIESDYARSGDATRKRNRAAMKFDVSPVSPVTTGQPPAANVNVTYGRVTPQTVASAWQKTAEGYTMEWHVPVAALVGAKMEPGSKIGFHYVLRDDGKTIEQFADTTGKSNIWRSPITWWAIKLTH